MLIKDLMKKNGKENILNMNKELIINLKEYIILNQQYIIDYTEDLHDFMKFLSEDENEEIMKHRIIDFKKNIENKKIFIYNKEVINIINIFINSILK